MLAYTLEISASNKMPSKYLALTQFTIRSAVLFERRFIDLEAMFKIWPHFHSSPVNTYKSCSESSTTERFHHRAPIFLNF